MDPKNGLNQYEISLADFILDQVFKQMVLRGKRPVSMDAAKEVVADEVIKVLERCPTPSPKTLLYAGRAVVACLKRIRMEHDPSGVMACN